MIQVTFCQRHLDASPYQQPSLPKPTNSTSPPEFYRSTNWVCLLQRLIDLSHCVCLTLYLHEPPWDSHPIKTLTESTLASLTYPNNPGYSAKVSSKWPLWTQIKWNDRTAVGSAWAWTAQRGARAQKSVEILKIWSDWKAIKRLTWWTRLPNDRRRIQQLSSRNGQDAQVLLLWSL